MADTYFRKVFKGAWKKTVPASWNRHKIATIAISLIGALVVGGWSGAWGILPVTLGGVIGTICVAPVLFVWGIFETQQEMYREAVAKRLAAEAEHVDEQPAPVKPMPAQPTPPPDNSEKVDFKMYRHLQQMPLRTAAQLWAGQVPEMRMQGQAKQTYAMLCGGIQSGEIPFEGGPLPGMQRPNLKYYKQQPHPELIVTREGLKAFAAQHKYNPRFLRGD
jgi:hypothetical protein